jgi:hypothetical protein
MIDDMVRRAVWKELERIMYRVFEVHRQDNARAVGLTPTDSLAPVRPPIKARRRREPGILAVGPRGRRRKRTRGRPRTTRQETKGGTRATVVASQ